MERAAIWRRVSSDRQDEQNQERDTERYCSDHGYEVMERYDIHARSAYHGRQQADLDRALNDMRSNKYTVLVVWHSDRLERREGKALLDLLAEFSAAGGRVESVQEPMLGQLDMGSQITTFMAGLMNHEKSRHIAEQVKLAHDRIATNAGNPGRAPYGYVSVGEKYSKTLAPTDEGRKYVPQIFQRIANGESLANVSAWFESETGISWFPRRIAWMIRNPTYRGRRINAEGVTVHRCEPLVDGVLWERANKILTAKPGKRGAASGPSAMLTSVLFCGDCADEGKRSAMYRIQPRKGYLYYRCNGEGTSKGCGLMVKLAETEATAIEWLSAMDRPRMVPTLILGDNHASAISDIAAELAELPKRGLSDDEEDAERSRLRSERNRLSALPSTPDRVELLPTGKTIGQHFASLDSSQRRAWMLQDGIRFLARRSDFMPLAIEFGDPDRPFADVDVDDYV